MKNKLCAILAMIAVSVIATPVASAQVKIGFLGGFTGPIASLTEDINDGFRLAISQINQAGGTSHGTIEMVTGDTSCTDSTIATNSADRMVNDYQVHAIVGALCSGATTAAATSISIPGRVVMLSPASTTPKISDIDDNDLLFRNVVSDSAQGASLAKLLIDKGIRDLAVTYVNNDYGSAFNDAFSASYEELGGLVTLALAHEDGKADYRGELGSLESTGSTSLLILAYADGSGGNILQQALENGHFTQYIGGDGMVAGSLIDRFGEDEISSMISTRPGVFDYADKDRFFQFANASNVNISGTYVTQAYDAAFALALAIEKNGISDTSSISQALRDVSSAPGVKIYPGEWQKASALIQNGQDINYEGASGLLEFDENGDVQGLIVELAIRNGEFTEVGLIE